MELALLTLQHISKCLELLPTGERAVDLSGIWAVAKAAHTAIARCMSAAEVVWLQLEPVVNNRSTNIRPRHATAEDKRMLRHFIDFLVVSRCSWPAMYLAQTISCYGLLLELQALERSVLESSSSPGVLQPVPGTRIMPFLLDEPGQLKDAWGFACAKAELLPLAHQQLLALLGCSNTAALWMAASMAVESAAQSDVSKSLGVTTVELVRCCAVLPDARYTFCGNENMLKVAAAAGCCEMQLQPPRVALQQWKQQAEQRLLQLQAERDMCLLFPAVALHFDKHCCAYTGTPTTMAASVPDRCIDLWQFEWFLLRRLCGAVLQQQIPAPALQPARLAPLVDDLLGAAVPALERVLDYVTMPASVAAYTLGVTDVDLRLRLCTLSLAEYLARLSVLHVSKYAPQQQQQRRNRQSSQQTSLEPATAAAWLRHAAAVCSALERMVRSCSRSPAGLQEATQVAPLACVCGCSAWSELDPRQPCAPHPKADSTVLRAAIAAGPGSPEQRQLRGLAFSLLKYAGALGPAQQQLAEQCRLCAATTALRMMQQSLPSTQWQLNLPQRSARFVGEVSAVVPWMALAGRCLLYWAQSLQQWLALDARQRGEAYVSTVRMLLDSDKADITGELAPDQAVTNLVTDIRAICMHILKEPEVVTGFKAFGYDAQELAQQVQRYDLMGMMGIAALGPLRNTPMAAMFAPMLTDDKLRQTAAELEEMGLALSNLAFPNACNNPWCKNVSEVSEVEIVTGKGKKCSGCCTARYCSKECRDQHWKQHKSVCRALGAAADRQGVPR